MNNSTPPVSRRERRRAKDRAAVLQAAAEMFAEHGYNETGMTQIADAADFSVGKLYTLFESKEDLFVSLVEDRARNLTEHSSAATDPSATPLDQMRQQLSAVLNFFDVHPAFSCIFLKEYPSTADGIIAQEMQRHIARATQQFQLAMDAGQIAQEDPEALAAMLTASIGSLIDICESRDMSGGRRWILDYIDRFFLRPLENGRSGVAPHAATGTVPAP